MSDRPTITWTGKSGAQYKFTVFDIGSSLKDGQDGVYLFVKSIPSASRIEAVYIGEGDLGVRTKFHKANGCVVRKGSTHIHAMLERDGARRLAIEDDLLAEHTEAYSPSGCNERKGG
ncbi:MAG TPA: hypothetical protein PKE21_15645 [Flavobacteriales bacterium]|nr:hypothetical protein [Flavobacteriales bacterium]HMR28916.1 hypothetical protein [Flavobacteriales bacterium]